MTRRKPLTWETIEDGADLLATILLVLMTIGAVILPTVEIDFVTAILAFVFTGFLPGYSVVAAMYPAVAGTTPGDSEVAGIDGWTRVVLSIGVSVVVVPLIALVLVFGGIDPAPESLVLTVGGFTLVVTGIATYFRFTCPPTNRFRIPYRELVIAVKRDIFQPTTRTDLVVNVIVVLSLLFLVASLTYVMTVPADDEQFTEFYLLSNNETGQLVAGGYLSADDAGQVEPLVIGVRNHEYETIRYEVVVKRQQFSSQSSSGTPQNETELARFQETVEHNSTWSLEYDVSGNVSTIEGKRVKLQFQLYTNGGTSNTTGNSVYRSVHLWINGTQDQSAVITQP